MICLSSLPFSSSLDITTITSNLKLCFLDPFLAPLILNTVLSIKYNITYRLHRQDRSTWKLHLPFIVIGSYYC